MKTDREKLTELIARCEDKYPCRDKQDYREFKEYLADYLISKGVTIPVRCGECIYNEMGTCNLAECNNPQYDENYYCRDGERKEE